jgi:hypothetical protein
VQVSDGTSISTDLVTISADPSNSAPAVSAGPDIDVAEGEEVQLTSVASDDDDDPLTYSWEQIAGPAVELSDPTDPEPTFVAPDVSEDTEIKFRLTVSDGVNESSDVVKINIDGVNDPPVIDAGAFQSVDEGDTVSLAASGTDSEGAELTYTWRQTGGVPVAITGADGADATFEAPEGVANSYLTFEVEASDGTHTVTDTIVVLVNADNDAPTIDTGPNLTVQENSVVEIPATASDPEGRELSHSWEQTGGPAVELSDSYALSPSFTAPNVAEDTEMTFSVTTTDGVNTVVDTITITVEGVNDAPEPTNATTVATEDTPSPVLLSGTDPDLGHSVETIRIDTLPSDGVLSFGGVPVNPGDTFTAAQVGAGDLVFTPASDFSGESSLTFSVSDGEAWSDAAATQTIVVVADADAPVLSTADASCTEGGSTPLSVGVDLADTDGSESITSVRVSGAPVGSVFTDGTSAVTAWDGTADLSSLDLNNLSIQPAENQDTDFVLTFSATSTEAEGGDTATGAATLTVSMDAVNDPPIAVDGSVAIDEDGTAVIALGASEVDTGDAATAFRIETLPEHGTLLLDGDPVTAGDEVSAYDISHGRLTFEPDADWAGTTSLDFSVTDGEVWSEADASFTINVSGVADAPDVVVSDAYGSEEGAIDVSIAVASVDVDGSESISAVTISGAPAGSVFTDGVNTVPAVGLPVDVTGWDLDNLQITPAKDYDIDFDLEVSVTATEPDSGHSTTTTESLTVHVNAVNDAPIVESGSLTVAEDSEAVIYLSAGELDTGDQVESFRVDELPSNGRLLLDGVEVAEGQVIDKTLVDGGSLTFEPDAHWSGETSLRFSASDGDLWSESQGEFGIAVTGVADDAVLTAGDVSGFEDSPIALDLSASVTDTDGSETVSVTVSGVPEGASLSAGVDNGDGSWTLSVDEIDGVEITPPSNFSGEFDLTATATTTDDSGDTASVVSTFTVSVEGVADNAALTAGDVSGLEDSPIALDLSASVTDTDGSETVSSVTVSGVPDGREPFGGDLSASVTDTDGSETVSSVVDNGDGSWTLSVRLRSTAWRSRPRATSRATSI